MSHTIYLLLPSACFRDRRPSQLERCSRYMKLPPSQQNTWISCILFLIYQNSLFATVRSMFFQYSPAHSSPANTLLSTRTVFLFLGFSFFLLLTFLTSGSRVAITRDSFKALWPSLLQALTPAPTKVLSALDASQVAQGSQPALFTDTHTAPLLSM